MFFIAKLTSLFRRALVGDQEVLVMFKLFSVPNDCWSFDAL